jgi:uncharacterized protein
MIRLLVYGLVILFAYKLWKSWAGALFKGNGGDSRHGDPTTGTGLTVDTHLIKDPQCGVYFLKKRGVEAQLHGEWLYFCSGNCRDEYLRHHGND